MSTPDLLARAAADPLVRYALLGAAVLAAAALLGGWTRGDVRALTRPATWAAVAAAVLAATALAAAGDRIGATLPGGWPLEGFRRFPLHLLALGYGPSPAVLAGLAFAAVESGQPGLAGAEAVLVLELAAIGWIAIDPSPRRRRLSAPLAVLVGWGLATATLGLAGRAADGASPSLSALLLDEGAVPVGVLASAALTLLPTTRWWRRAAPGASRGVTGVPAVDDGRRVLEPLERPRRRGRSPLRDPVRPDELARRRRPRAPLRAPPPPPALTLDPTADPTADRAADRPADRPAGRMEARTEARSASRGDGD